MNWKKTVQTISKASVLFIALLLVRCAHRQPVPMEPLMQYDPSEVEAFVSGIDSQFDSLGFKGLHLGMTYEHVNQLVKKTPWGYLPRGSSDAAIAQASWADLPQYLPSNFLRADRTEMARTWARIGCERPESAHGCYEFSYVNIKFFEGKLILVSVASPTCTKEQIGKRLKPWARYAFGRLVQEYGKPDRIVEPVDDITDASFQSGYESLLSEWRKDGQRAGLYIGEYESNFACSILLEDTEGVMKSINDSADPPS